MQLYSSQILWISWIHWCELQYASVSKASKREARVNGSKQIRGRRELRRQRWGPSRSAGSRARLAAPRAPPSPRASVRSRTARDSPPGAPRSTPATNTKYCTITVHAFYPYVMTNIENETNIRNNAHKNGIPELRTLGYSIMYCMILYYMSIVKNVWILYELCTPSTFRMYEWTNW